MNTKMFLKITENVANSNIVNKDNLIVSGTGMKAEELKEYFKKVLIKRSRPIVDMKKNIAKLIVEVHNKKYYYNKDLIYSLTDIANLLDIKSHASVLNYFKNEKTDDKLSLFVKENFLRWISEKKYPIPHQLGDKKDYYVLLKNDEIENIKLTRCNKINSIDFHQFVSLKNREHYISG
jgi:hypothetical protein